MKSQLFTEYLQVTHTLHCTGRQVSIINLQNSQQKCDICSFAVSLMLHALWRRSCEHCVRDNAVDNYD